MNKYALILLGLFAIQTTVQTQAHESPSNKITLRGDVWCPYNCDPAQSERLGYMIDVFKAAFEPHGYVLDYQTLNWSRSIKESREGQWDGIIGAAKSDAKDFVFPKKAQGVNETCFFVKLDDSWVYRGSKSLEGRTVGAVQDYGYDDPEFAAFLKKNATNENALQLVGGDDALSRNIEKIKFGRINTVVDNDFVVSESLGARTDGFRLKKSGCIKKEKLYIAFSPKKKESQALAKILSDETSKMRKNGRLKKILDKYGLRDFE